jgi:CHAT domain-containing protein
MPHAEREVRGIAALFPTARTRILVGHDAGPERARAGAREAAILHLAVPGLLVDASPMHTLLALAPPPQPGADDGTVEAADLMSWDVAARTVVLSRLHGDPALQSAGAATRALAWAWFVAGAPTTVVTQWVVDAPGTSALMQAFHRQLTPAAGPAPRASEALRLATLRLLRGAARHPYYWAGFMVMGDAR